MDFLEGQIRKLVFGLGMYVASLGPRKITLQTVDIKISQRRALNFSAF
jgi:hypothetical protein